MKVLHRGPLNSSSGGPAQSTYWTLKALAEAGVAGEVIMPSMRAGDTLVGDDLSIHFMGRPVDGGRLGYVPYLRRQLSRLGEYDIYHIHGIWSLHNSTIANYARKQKKPYIISLRGALYPQSLQQSVWIKRFSMSFYQGADLRRAACIHATCPEELEYFRALGFHTPVAVIPNPLHCCDVPIAEIPLKKTVRIGYLGRLVRLKRVERLIEAFQSLGELVNDAELVIVGDGDPQYEKSLREQVRKAGLTNVTFAGFLTGAAKEEAIKSLSLLVLPSDHENFGMVVLEALIRGIPVIAAKGTPWAALETNRCGWWCDNQSESLKAALREALLLTAEERREMGYRGIALATENFSSKVIAGKMKQMYEWCLTGDGRPDFIEIEGRR